MELYTTLKGKLTTFDTPIGVITNSPSYDWYKLDPNAKKIKIMKVNGPEDYQDISFESK